MLLSPMSRSAGWRVVPVTGLSRTHCTDLWDRRSAGPADVDGRRVAGDRGLVVLGPAHSEQPCRHVRRDHQRAAGRATLASSSVLTAWLVAVIAVVAARGNRPA